MMGLGGGSPPFLQSAVIWVTPSRPPTLSSGASTNFFGKHTEEAHKQCLPPQGEW